MLQRLIAVESLLIFSRMKIWNWLANKPNLNCPGFSVAETGITCNPSEFVYDTNVQLDDTVSRETT